MFHGFIFFQVSSIKSLSQKYLNVDLTNVLPKSIFDQRNGFVHQISTNVMLISLIASIFRSAIEWGFELFNDLQSRLPNLPVFGWLSMKNLTEDSGTGCSKYPDIMDLHFRNKYWQIFEFVDENPDPDGWRLDVNFHLYGAYFDNRTLLPDSQSMVRVISMVNSRLVDEPFKSKSSNLCYRDKPVSLPFCHIWYNDSKSPVVTKVTGFEMVITNLI